jgi:hypothetical protein
LVFAIFTFRPTRWYSFTKSSSFVTVSIAKCRLLSQDPQDVRWVSIGIGSLSFFHENGRWQQASLPHSSQRCKGIYWKIRSDLVFMIQIVLKF